MKNKYIFLLIIILIVHSIFVILSMNQPFHGDEVAFPECVKGVLENGKPILDFSAFRPNFQCLWHPPLYIYLIALSAFIFGKNVYSFRMVSAIFNLFTILLVYLITKEIFKNNKNKEIIALIASFIYAFNPLTIQSSIIMDIDGGLLNFFTMLFIYFFIKNKKFYWIIFSLLFIFWSKETGPVLLFTSIFLFYASQKEWKNVIKFVGVFLISFLLYLATFFIYTNILGLDFSKPFVFNMSSNVGTFNLIKNSEFYVYLLQSAWSFKSFFYFAVPFFVILFIFNSIKFYNEILKKKRIEQDEKNLYLLNIFSFVSIIFFILLGATAWGFPKYHITALPSMAIFIAGKLNFKKFKEIKLKNTLTRIILLTIILSLYFIFIVGNPLLPEFDASARGTVQSSKIFEESKLVAYSFILYAIIPFIISMLLFIRIKRKILLSLIFLIVFIYFYINILHTSVEYSTYSKYGDYGINEVVDYFKNNNIPPNKIATYPNIGYYIGMSNYYDITYGNTRVERFRDYIINNKNITYITLYERDIERVGKENMDYFNFEKKIGTYYIYKRK